MLDQTITEPPGHMPKTTISKAYRGPPHAITRKPKDAKKADAILEHKIKKIDKKHASNEGLLSNKV